MNQDVTRQVAARNEKWVATKERVKISTTNVTLETIVPQKENTFQVIIDVIKNTTCYKAFTIYVEVSEIFMQQFWYTVKKVLGINSYDFILANKKCVVDAKVFWKILDICPRFQGVNFVEVLDDEATLTFPLSLGYKGPLHKHPNILRKSRIDILWGMSYTENVDYPELIWEDFAFQIDNRQLKKGRHKNMPYLRLKFVRISEDYQEYGLPILETMLTEGIKQSESYQMFIKYSTDVTLGLGKSISLTEAVEEEAARQIHATHERIVTKFDLEPGSSEGTGVSPGVPDESTIVPATSSEGIDNNEETDDEFVHGEEHVQDDEEETNDEFVHGDEQVNDDEDEGMTNAEVKESGNGNEDITDVAKYKQFSILEEESIDNDFSRFNTIIKSLKALNEGFSSKNYVRKFLRALHPKWKAKVTAIEKSNDLSSPALDELIGNLKVHEVVREKDSEIYKGKKERVKSIALKAKKECSDDETSTFGSDDEEYVMVVRNFKKFFRRKDKFVRQPRKEKKLFRQRDEKKGKSDQKFFRCGDPNHLIGNCPKPPHDKDQKALIRGSWSDSENDAKDKTNNETCLMAQSSNE
nr:zf-CCHC domain-containing protein/UBN2 domain-containing protein [Tanacetum cinerariifolium]